MCINYIVHRNTHYTGYIKLGYKYSNTEFAEMVFKPNRSNVVHNMYIIVTVYFK